MSGERRGVSKEKEGEKGEGRTREKEVKENG